MPYILAHHKHTPGCSKGIISKTTIVHVPPSKFKPDEHELAALTAKQLVEAAKKYPKEYAADLGYIGKGADVEDKE
jgi:hypothetical protein